MTTQDPAAVLTDYLLAAPEGTRVWVRGLGRSMWPLLDAGDGLEVERCGEDVLRRGHIALSRAGDGALSAHLVVSARPLRTTSFLGPADERPGEILGRAVTLERLGRRVPLEHRFARVTVDLRRLLFLFYGTARVAQTLWRWRRFTGDGPRGARWR